MVKITNFHKVEKKDGTSFFSLELVGGIEIINSQSTGRPYITARKCKLTSTFDEAMANSMIGQELDGDIVRITVEPYSYMNKTTGEILQLQHSYAYKPKRALNLWKRQYK